MKEFNIIIYALSIKIRGGKKDYIEVADIQIYQWYKFYFILQSKVL